MDPALERRQLDTRRQFLGRSGAAVGTAALLGRDISSPIQGATPPAISGFPNFAPKAKRVIYLMQGGAPSRVDLLDWKPGLYDKTR